MTMTDVDTKVLPGRTGLGAGNMPNGVRIYDVSDTVQTISILEVAGTGLGTRSGSGVWLEWTCTCNLYVLVGPTLLDPLLSARFDASPNQQALRIAAERPWMRWWDASRYEAKVVTATGDTGVLYIERVSVITGDDNDGA